MPRRSERLRRYGLTPASYDALLAAQDGRCGICRTDNNGLVSNFTIDHDHRCCRERARSCGRCVRGLLCGGCNGLLGLYELTFQQDAKLAYLQAQNDYLTRHRARGLPDLLPGRPGPPIPDPYGDEPWVLVEYHPEWIVANAHNIRENLTNRPEPALLALQALDQFLATGVALDGFVLLASTQLGLDTPT